MEILKEVEDKREYHAVHLIDELKIDFKDRLKEEYKNLSTIIHPTHEQIMATISDVLGTKGIPTDVNCDQVSNIYELMKKMYDIFFFLFIEYFPEVKEALEKSSDFIEYIRKYNLYLLSKILNVRFS